MRWWNGYVLLMLIVVAVPMLIAMVPAHVLAVPLLIVIVACEAVPGRGVAKGTIHVEPTLFLHVEEHLRGARRLHLR